MPDFVITLALAPQLAAVVEQNRPQWRVETAAHGLANEQIARRTSRGVNEIDPSRLQIEIKAVFRGDFGSGLPEAFRQRVISGRFHSEAHGVARRHPHATFRIMNDLCHVSGAKLSFRDGSNVQARKHMPLTVPRQQGNPFVTLAMAVCASSFLQSLDVRVFADDAGEPWFCAADVCAVLGYRNSRRSIDLHCRDQGVTKRYIPTESGNQEMTYINEGNVYRLIIKSRKPEAQAFERELMEVNPPRHPQDRPLRSQHRCTPCPISHQSPLDDQPSTTRATSG
jgi:hypothetical protein